MNWKRPLRFSLRTFLLAAALLVPVGYVGQQCWTAYRHHRELTTLMAMFRGGGSAVEEPVRDGQVILVCKGRAVGAFIPVEQGVVGESLKYRWCYRTDGNGRLDETNGPIVTGTSTATQTHGRVYVRFGQFDIEWSLGMEGWGWIYYDRVNTPVPQRICVTKANSLRRLDALDSRWLYKTSAADVGALATTGQAEGEP